MNQIKLDLKDRKILYQLDRDCRQTSTQIAKKVGLSTEVANYRIKRLEKENIITQYQVALNLSKLGIIQFKILLSFQHMTSEKLDRIIKELDKNKNVKWIVSCKGNWDLLIALEAKSLQEIDGVKDSVLEVFGSYISKKAISICTYAEVYDRDFLLEKYNPNRTRILVDGQKEIKIDELDMKILRQLAENARKPIVDIAIYLKTSARVVNYRIRQLVKKGVITGFRIALNYEKLGIQFYKLFVYLENPDEKRFTELMNYFRRNKNATHNLKVVGNWDLEPELEVYSEAEFNLNFQELKDKFSDIIKNVDIVTISKEHKFVYM